MRLGKFTKTPAERKRYQADYTNWLDTGETLSTVTYVVSPTTTSPLVVDASAIAGDGLSVAFFVNAGLDETDYTVTLTATTSGGQIKQDTLLFVVRA